MNANPSPPAGPNPTRPGGRDLPVVWIVAVAVVLIAGVTALVLARHSGNKEVAGQTSKKVVVGTTTTTGPGSTAPGGTSTTESGSTETTGPASTTGTLPLYEATQADTAVGMTIPTVTGQDFNGDSITIGPSDTAQVIMFVAHWCPHCQAEVPRIVAHLQTNPLPADVKLMTVSTSVQVGADNYPPEAWLAREHWPAPVLADDANNTVAQAFGLRSFPYFVAVDASGKVVVRVSGEITTAQFDLLVQAAETGRLPG